jgi:hypothetical protein
MANPTAVCSVPEAFERGDINRLVVVEHLAPPTQTRAWFANP